MESDADDVVDPVPEGVCDALPSALLLTDTEPTTLRVPRDADDEPDELGGRVRLRLPLTDLLTRGELL